MLFFCWLGSRQECVDAGRDVARESFLAARARELLDDLAQIDDQLDVYIMAAAEIIDDGSSISVFEASGRPHIGSDRGSES
jgi:hypothetical protein